MICLWFTIKTINLICDIVPLSDDDELLDSPSENTETTKDNTQTSSGDNVNTLLTQTQESLSMSKEMSKTTANPLAQYFSNTSDSPFRRGGGDFFDSLCDKPETAPENTNQNSSSVELFNDNAAGSSKEADPAVQNTTKDIDTSGIQGKCFYLVLIFIGWFLNNLNIPIKSSNVKKSLDVN